MIVSLKAVCPRCHKPFTCESELTGLPVTSKYLGGDVISIVSAVSGVTVDDIVDTSIHTNDACDARFVALYLLRHAAGLSLQLVAKEIPYNYDRAPRYGIKMVENAIEAEGIEIDEAALPGMTVGELSELAQRLHAAVKLVRESK